MQTILRAFLLTVSAFLCAQAHAFGANGHMAVGTIADELIAGTNAAKEARKILGSNLRTAAVWADCAKGVNTTTFKYGGDGKYPECAVYENPGSKAQMVAFVRRNVGNCTSAHNTEVCHKQYHYTDVAIQRVAYVKGQVGTSEQDVVAAVAAMIAVLQGNEAPEPFKIAGKKEALRLLSHYLGDIHQPLHVAAVYLDTDGQVVDPDEGVFDAATETQGGNVLMLGTKRLHGEWDSVGGVVTSSPLPPGILKKARAVPATPGPMEQWSTAWASEVLVEGKAAFDGLTYSSENTKHQYQITIPAGYNQMKAQVQREQVIKAGARLAQILTTIWP